MLTACSINAVLALGQAYRRGDPEPRKVADLIVIDKDLVELAARGDANLAWTTRVQATIFDGAAVFKSQE
jgi:predicted amidohydrolase YtcJ